MAITVLVAVSVGVMASSSAQAANPQRIIIDQDIINNVDDIGALASAFALERRGEAKVLAVTTNARWQGSTANVYEASWKCQAAIAQFYGHGDVPIGVMDSATGVAEGTPHVQACAAKATAPVATPGKATDVIVKALKNQPDNSVVLVSTGYLGNYSKLLNTVENKALVAQKVSKLVIMGGRYPTGTENNIQFDVASADKVATNWPTKIVWVGSEVGNAIDISVTNHPASSPVAAAYQAFSGQKKAWDLTAVYRAVRPTGASMSDSAVGTNAVNTTTGVNTFTTNAATTPPGTGNQLYTLLNDAGDAAKKINALLNEAVWPITTTTTTTTTTTVPGGQSGTGSEVGGYRIVHADGAVESHGVVHYGDMAGKPLNLPMINAVRTATNNGYWLLGLDGGIFTYGDADFYGSMGGKRLNMPIVGMASTSTGKGYWLVALDGGVFAFGDAKFYGSMGGKPLNEPVVGITASPTGNGYWLVAADGGIFAYGDAGFYGSMGGKPLNAMVVGMTAGPGGQGYRMVAEDGGIFSFEAPFYGSMGGKAISDAIAGMTPTSNSQGYWMVALDGTVYAFGNATVVARTGGSRSDEIVVALA